MKERIGILAAVLATSLAVPAASAERTSPGWDKLKSLVGEWVGTYEGQPARASYRLVSRGTALEETLDVAVDASQMVTIYHPDGASLLLTHYCDMGNQPRMRTPGLQEGRLDFVFVDASNLKSAEDHVMSRLVLTFPGEGRYVQEWTSKQGTKEHTGRFEFTRKK